MAGETVAGHRLGRSLSWKPQVVAGHRVCGPARQQRAPWSSAGVQCTCRELTAAGRSGTARHRPRPAGAQLHCQPPPRSSRRRRREAPVAARADRGGAGGAGRPARPRPPARPPNTSSFVHRLLPGPHRRSPRWAAAYLPSTSPHRTAAEGHRLQRRPGRSRRVWASVRPPPVPGCGVAVRSRPSIFHRPQPVGAAAATAPPRRGRAAAPPGPPAGRTTRRRPRPRSGRPAGRCSGRHLGTGPSAGDRRRPAGRPGRYGEIRSDRRPGPAGYTSAASAAA